MAHHGLWLARVILVILVILIILIFLIILSLHSGFQVCSGPFCKPLSLLFLGQPHQYMVIMIMKVAKAMATDVYTTAVWSPSVSVVNSVAEERIPRLRRNKYSIMFFYTKSN